MRPPPPDMTNSALLGEATENARELLQLAKSIKGFSVWDKSMIALNVAAALAGLALIPPTGGVSIVLTILSGLLLAADIAKKVRDLRVDGPTRARILELEARNEELMAEIRRRFLS